MIPLAVPEAVEIQTASYCNAGCIICPHPTVSPSLPTGTMDPSLFATILEQLDGVRRIIPYLNNEPFIDPLYSDRLRLVRERHPTTEIEISTNLSPLSERKRRELRDVRVDDFRMSFFGFTKSTYERIMPGLDWDLAVRRLNDVVQDAALRDSFGVLRLIMVDHAYVPEQEFADAQAYCRANGIEFNRWGSLDRAGNVRAFKNEIHKTVTRGCEQDRPLKRMHITVEGKVVLCCQDWRHEVVLGDLRTQPLLDVWSSPGYRQVRESLYDPSREAPDPCKRCKLAI